MQQKWFIRIIQNSKHIILLSLVVCHLSLAQAEYFNPVTDKARHYVGLSLSGAESNNLPQNTISMLPGYATSLDFRYEIDYHHVLIGIGLGAQYQGLQDKQEPFSDEFSRADKEGDPLIYAYQYETYTQRSTMLNVELPISVGYNFSKYGYFLAGAKLTIPVKATYSTQTEMLTTGFYPWATEVYQSSENMNLSNYGFFPKNLYEQTSDYKEQLRASVNVEIGGFLPIDDQNKNRLRIGLYADLGFRVGTFQPTSLVDYTELHKIPHITSQKQLADLIRFNPLLTSDKYSHLPGTLEVGIRITWLIDATIKNEKCLLCEQTRKSKGVQRKYFH